MPEDHAEYKQAEEQFEENKASNNSDVEMDADEWNEEIERRKYALLYCGE